MPYTDTTIVSCARDGKVNVLIREFGRSLESLILRSIYINALIN